MLKYADSLVHAPAQEESLLTCLADLFLQVRSAIELCRAVAHQLHAATLWPKAGKTRCSTANSIFDGLHRRRACSPA